MSIFIPSFHFVPAADKLMDPWCNDAVNYCWYNTKLVNLLKGKNINEIEGFSNGDYDLRPFKRMFRSLRAQQLTQDDANIPEQEKLADRTGIQWSRVAIIPHKINSAVATLQKIPIEITATCLDPLAQKRKQEDLEFMKNKRKIEEFLQPLYDGLNLGKVDLGATKYSSVPFREMPMDLNAQDEEEFKIFQVLMYNLAPETAFEVVLQAFAEFKKLNQIRYLESRDQIKWGVSVHRAPEDMNTGLPNVEYTFPGMVETDGSLLPDYSDNTIRAFRHVVTPMQLFNYFPNEICDEEHLETIINFKGSSSEDWSRGYAPSQGLSYQKRADWDNLKLSLIEFEIKSVDNAMVAKSKSGYKYFTKVEKKCDSRIWGQNTYRFYWLEKTKYCFGKNRLGFAYRAKGSEIYSGFTSSIYKSQDVSAVEHCIGENKKAQVAEIKLQHFIIMSKPPGTAIDQKYLRNVIDGLTDDMKGTTVTSLLEKYEEHNILLYDTAGFEDKQTGQQNPPVRDLPGGIKDDILGYYRIIAEANKAISDYLSVNDQLTGQSATPEGLVGVQKLLISGAMNGIYYITEAITAQYKNLFNIWAWYIKEAIKKGGAPKQALINIIGSRKVDIIRGMEDIPLHQTAITITLGQRVEERERLRIELDKLEGAGVLNAADRYFIDNTQNRKDAAWIVAVKQNMWLRKQEQQQIRALQSQENIKKMEGQNMLAQTQAATDGKGQLIQAQGDVDAKLMQLGKQLGLTQSQIDSYNKRLLQKERIDAQKDKSIQTINANNQQKAQTPFQ